MGHPHHTQHDRKRKIRINDRQDRRFMRQVRMIENMSADHKSALGKLVAAEARGQILSKEELANWRELRTMGVVREDEGRLLLTLVGRETASQYSV